MPVLFAETVDSFEGKLDNKADRWKGKRKYKWLRDKTSKKKGTVAEKIFLDHCISLDHDVEISQEAGHDLIVDDYKIECKLSTGINSGNEKLDFLFQQIRINRDFDFLACIGCHPDDKVYLWIVPKHVALEHTEKQHHDEVCWFKFDADNIPDWIKPYDFSKGDFDLDEIQ